VCRACLLPLVNFNPSTSKTLHVCRPMQGRDGYDYLWQVNVYIVGPSITIESSRVSIYQLRTAPRQLVLNQRAHSILFVLFMMVSLMNS